MSTYILRKAAISVASIGLFVYHVFCRIILSGLNTRTIFSLPLNFFLNFLPVFVWLLIFKNAGLIPIEIRPNIHVPLAFHVDTFVFSVTASPFGSVISIAVLVVSAWLLYIRFYRLQQNLPSKIFSSQEEADPEHDEFLECGDSSEESSSENFELSDLDPQVNNKKHGKSFTKYTEVSTAPSDFQNHPRIGKLEFIPNLSSIDISENAAAINRKIILHLQSSSSTLPYNCWYLAPPILLASSWFVLNLDQNFATPITTMKDQISWCSYVLGHFCVPLFTSIWLYVFHCPGALKLFSFALGTQNIAGVMTHLLMPTAPPWFIHKNGENAPADYHVLGYAAGLTRAHFSTGTHIVNNGFHKSPIVFGAVPSLHSAMAVLCFLFVCYYSRWLFAKLLLLGFVILQWWATIYLDHHWRIDLLIGMFYAITSFTFWYRFRLARYTEDFIKARLRYDFSQGSTMGMRVFRNTRLQNFFDPLS